MTLKVEHGGRRLNLHVSLRFALFIARLAIKKRSGADYRVLQAVGRGVRKELKRYVKQNGALELFSFTSPETRVTIVMKRPLYRE